MAKQNILLILVICLLSGCRSTPLAQYYDNPQAGIKLEYPNNWEIKYSERNGTVYLKAGTGYSEKESAFVEIRGGACIDPSEQKESSTEILQRDIERIGKFYDLNAVAVVQAPTTVKMGEKDITTAVVTVPSMTKNEKVNALRSPTPGSDDRRTIEIMVIKNGDYDYVMAYIYKGDNELLNAQAKKIIDSIQRSCSTEL